MLAWQCAEVGRKEKQTVEQIQVKRNVLLNPGPAATTDTVKFARENQCEMIEVFSNMQRTAAHRFYAGAGFQRGWYGFSKP
jgi:translation initiation factor 2 gamma subunit (eIF-2gamma)